MPNVLVITPTTGSEEVKQACHSVINQTIETDHLLVCDGNQFKDNVKRIVSEVNHPRVNACYLPFNTGGNGFYGHRIMAGFSHLINHEFVLFLDQDNWYDKDHVETLVKEITTYKFDWSYSLRKIFSKDGRYLIDDNCESLGRWPVWVQEDSYLIDSSSYCFRTEFFRKVGHIWDFGWGADRRFYMSIKTHNNYGCSGKHTLCYKLGGNEGSVQKEFFETGNNMTMLKYNGKFPWHVQFS